MKGAEEFTLREFALFCEFEFEEALPVGEDLLPAGDGVGWKEAGELGCEEFYVV